MDKTRILFAGTPEIAVPLFEKLCTLFDVAGVLTAEDAPQGRSKTPVPSAVKTAALKAGVPVLQFGEIKSEAREAVSALKPDVLVTFAFGRIFGPKFLSLFPKGTFNVHPSALPQFRGASPIQSGILAGLKECTVTLQSLTLKMDEGDIWKTVSFPLTGEETTQSLTQTVSLKAAEFVPQALMDALEGKIEPKEQSGEVSYCTKIEREESRLDFTRTVKELHCRIRALYPWPKAYAVSENREVYMTGVWGGYEYTENPDVLPEGAKAGETVVFRKDRGAGIACADGILYVCAFQLPTKKELDFKAFANGNPWVKNAVFC